MRVLRMVEPFENRDTQIQEFERLQRERTIQKRYEKCGIGRRYFDESLNTFQTDTEERQFLLEATTEFVSAVKNGEYRVLVLIGNCGTGKTHLAGGALRELGGHYYESISLVEQLKCSVYGKETAQVIINNMLAERLVVIDEIGRSRSGDEQRELFRVFNTLYNEQCSSILIGNFANTSAFFNYMGVGFVDRLVEGGRVIETKGDSYRLLKWRR